MPRVDQLTEAQVLRYAPDARSVNAALEVVQHGNFFEPRMSPDQTWLFASYRGTGYVPYDVVVDLNSNPPTTQCSCPSPKVPCKHALGLMLLALRQPGRFLAAAAPVRAPRPVPFSQPPEPDSVPPPPTPRAPESAERAAMETAFLQSIVERPEDDTPRLVYSDWLMEQDDPRGEFIHVQCRLAQVTPNDPAWTTLKAREADLWLAHREDWLREVPLDTPERDNLRMKRGFLEEIRLTAKSFAREGDNLFRRHPIQHLGLDRLDQVADVKVQARSPLLERLRSLDLSRNWMGSHPALVQTLLGSPHLSQLQSLNLADNRIHPNQVVSMRSWPFIPQLRELLLPRNEIGDLGVVPLLSGGGLAELQHLDLSGNRLTTRAAEYLASGPLANLTRLDLANNAIRGAGAQALLASRNLPELRHLNLSNTQIDERSAESLLTESHLARLETLNLAVNDIGQRGAAALASCLHKTRLHTLNLTRNYRSGNALARGLATAAGPANLLVTLDLTETWLSAEGMKWLAQTAHLPALRGLILSSIGDAGLEALAGASHWPDLRQLSLANCGVGVRGLTALAHSPLLAGLVMLDLPDNHLGGVEVMALASGLNSGRLSVLNLARNDISDNGAEALAEADGLDDLSLLDLRNNPISATATEALRERFGRRVLLDA